MENVNAAPIHAILLGVLGDAERAPLAIGPGYAGAKSSPVQFIASAGLLSADGADVKATTAQPPNE